MSYKEGSKRKESVLVKRKCLVEELVFLVKR